MKSVFKGLFGRSGRETRFVESRTAHGKVALLLAFKPHNPMVLELKAVAPYSVTYMPASDYLARTIEQEPGGGMRAQRQDRWLTYQHDGRELWSTSSRDGGWSVSLPDAESAEALYADRLRVLSAQTSGVAPSRWPSFGAGLAAAFVGLAIFIAVVPGQPQQASRPVAAAPATQTTRSGGPIAEAAAAQIQAPAAGSKRVIDATLSQAEQTRVASAASIPMRAKGAAFYVFSDPNCPYCHELEGSLARLDPSFKPVMVPVGYKKGSKELAAAALCSKQPADSWRLAMAGKLDAAPCEAGLRQVEANMKLFEDLRLTSTPTLVTPGGVLVSGSASAEDLTQMFRQ